jgi:hypothetical protein
MEDCGDEPPTNHNEGLIHNQSLEMPEIFVSFERVR